LWWRRKKNDRLPIGQKRARKGSQEMKGAQWLDIRSDRQKGLSYVELGRKYHMEQRTAKRYAESPRKPPPNTWKTRFYSGSRSGRRTNRAQEDSGEQAIETRGGG